MEISPVTRITADAIGEPGQRVFYLQARGPENLVTIHVEKEQVQLLAASILEILARVGKETGEGPDDSEMDLEEPIEPRWRAGRLSIGYEEDSDLLLLEIEELVAGAEDEDADPMDLPDPDRVRLWATREQMLALSRQSATVAARGRPTCQFCGNPMDPEGHWCPAMNGHRPSADV
jgi:uncharacterized repeat protein (TIGR03847 family)